MAHLFLEKWTVVKRLSFPQFKALVYDGKKEETCATKDNEKSSQVYKKPVFRSKVDIPKPATCAAWPRTGVSMF